MHNPTGYLFGLNRLDSQLIVAGPTGPYYQGIDAFGDSDASPYHAPIRFYDALTTLEAPGSVYDCADISPVVGDQITYPNYNTLTSSFNKIGLISSTCTLPIEVTSNSSESCENVILTATYTTDYEVDSVSWTDPSSIEISTTTTALTDASGTYTFTVNLVNGCSVSQTILVD